MGPGREATERAGEQGKEGRRAGGKEEGKARKPGEQRMLTGKEK